MKIKEALLGIFIILIVLVLIVPIPSTLLDFLFMINIFFAVLILLDAIYAKKPLEMNMFPTILLVTTLFRISLNLASTKLILLEGDAGQVVKTFGEFVAGGNMVVGTIIFLILVLVNMMVITKGSGRVSEVTARFTLDAMPGKQMAIDADLNTGLISEEQAKARRKEIQDEAAFYGAMDGASKFVKGDAAAGIVITLINLVGGITLGMTGMATGTALPFGEAVEIYTLMTIGDGLVGQIPAILISTATGMLVTKSNEDDGLSGQIGRQLFSMPLTLYISGLVMIALGFTPLPTMFFVPFGFILILLGYRLEQSQKVQDIEEEITTEEEEVEEIRKPENVISLLNVDPILLIFGYGLIPLVDSNQGGDLLDRVVMIRRQIALELGAIVPIIRLRDDIKLAPNQYKIVIKGVEIAEGEILFDHYMAMNPGYVEDEIDGIETVEPYLGLPALWISEKQRERAEVLGYTVVDPPAIIATHLTEVVKHNLSELLSRQDVQILIDNVRQTHPVLIDELTPKLLGIGEIQKVLANLLKESISIRDLASILETLADYAQVTRDVDMLTEYARQSMKRNISQTYFGEGENRVITLDPKLEQTIMESIKHSEQGAFIALDPNTTQMIFGSLTKELTKLTSIGVQPIVLTSPIVRIYFKKLVEQIAPDLVVLSYNEIDPNAQIKSIGMVVI